MKLFLLGVFLIGELSFAQEEFDVVDLNRIAHLLNFPVSQLLITDNLDQEKFIYTKKTSIEQELGQIPPVDPASIYGSYLITSKTKSSFLPILISISKPDAYLTPEVQEIVTGLNFHASQQRIKGADVSYGDFKLPNASQATMFWEEIRVPAHSKRIIEPDDTWTRLDEYPKFHPAHVSIVRDASNKVDVRIAQYACLYYPEELVEVAGGEEYFATFNTIEEDPKESPKEPRKEVPILSIFKGLNQIVLTSPIMEPYLKKPVAPPSTQDQLKEEAAKPVPLSPGFQNLPIPSPSIAVTVLKWGLPVWVYLLLFFLCAGGFMAWLRKKRG